MNKVPFYSIHLLLYNAVFPFFSSLPWTWDNKPRFAGPEVGLLSGVLYICGIIDIWILMSVVEYICILYS